MGPPLDTLDLSYNALTETPDLSAVSGTLKFFIFKGNPLTSFPNITLNGEDTTFEYRNRSGILEDNIPLVCQISTFSWANSDLKNIPTFLCISSILYALTLENNKLNCDSDFTGLESISSSLQVLVLNYNKLTKFPNIPVSVRTNLKSLWLNYNQITTIDVKDITGYRLKLLSLEGNQMTVIPHELLLTGQTIKLTDNPLNDWDQYKWNDMICKAPSLIQLELSGSSRSLTQMPDIHSSLCNSPRAQTLTLVLESIPGPCDCSIEWMVNVTQQGCPVNLSTDALECETELQDLKLECPENGVVFYTEDNFSGNSLLVADTTSLEAFQQIKSIAVFKRGSCIHHCLMDHSSSFFLEDMQTQKKQVGLSIIFSKDIPLNKLDIS